MIIIFIYISVQSSEGCGFEHRGTYNITERPTEKILTVVILPTTHIPETTTTDLHDRSGDQILIVERVATTTSAESNESTISFAGTRTDMEQFST